jgi:hypothetical protein
MKVEVLFYLNYLNYSFLIDYTKLRNGDIGMAKLYDRIKMILKSGAVLCDRQYSFLAFSSSQLREHSCWMFHSRHNGNTTAHSIRKSMGKFENIRPVAKYAARVSEKTFFSGTVVKSVTLLRSSWVNHFQRRLKEVNLKVDILQQYLMKKRPTVNYLPMVLGSLPKI